MSKVIMIAWIIAGLLLSFSVIFAIMLRIYNKIEGNKKIDVTRIVNFILWFVKEMINTISSKPSHFSSKRIERLILFVSGVCIMDIYAYTHRSTMTAETMLMIVGAQMLWAGFNTTQLTTDKKVHAKIKEEGKSTDSTSDATEGN